MASNNNTIRGNNNSIKGDGIFMSGDNNGISGNTVVAQNINGVTILSGSNISLINVQDTIIQGDNITAFGILSGGTITGSNTTYITNLTVYSAITYPGGITITGATNDFTPFGGLITPSITGDTDSNLIIGQFSQPFFNGFNTGSTIINSQFGFSSVNSCFFSSLIGGMQNNISGAGSFLTKNSTILGGNDNHIIASGSNLSNIAIIACSGITAFTSNSVYVPAISIPTGSTSATAGQVRLNVNASGATAVIPNVRVTNSTMIFMSRQDSGSPSPSELWISNRQPGISFSITSNNVSDTGLTAWFFIEPA